MASRRTDTVAKDFDSIVESLVEFASTEFGPQTNSNRVWTDFNISSFSRNWAELLGYLGDQIMFYLDVQSNQAYLETATIPAYIARIAEQVGFSIPTQQSASGVVEFTTSGAYTIPSGTIVASNDLQYFTTRNISGNSAGTAQVDVVEGALVSEGFVAEGAQNESIILSQPLIVVDQDNANPELRSPIVTVNGETFTVVDFVTDSSPTDRIAKKRLLPDGRTQLIFGDGIFGQRLNPNQQIQVTYRTGGGSAGNVEIGEINQLVSTITNVDSVTNPARLTGGSDELTVEELKERVPLAAQTASGATALKDYADILEANFTQVLSANSAINNNLEGVDVDVFVLPRADTVTNITDNTTLFNTLTNFLEDNKKVGTKFLIQNAEEILMIIELEVFLNRDASRSSVESDIREKIAEFFDLQTGGESGTGIGFAETVKVGDIFDILKTIEEIDRFEVKKFTVSPRLEATVASPNQEFFQSEVEVFSDSEESEWAVVTSEVANPEPTDGQVGYTVFKRTLGTATSLTENTLTDSNLDLTLKSGNAIVVSSTTVTDSQNVFSPGQFDSQILVDNNNNIWLISETKSKSIIVQSPALNDASVTAVTNGAYSIVKSFLGEKIAINGISFTVLYNTGNTFFSLGANFNVIATAGTDFFLSEEQSNKGTYGVPCAISSVTAQGANPGDLVDIEFSGNPNLAAVDDTFVLIDRNNETFEVLSVSDDETIIAQYGSQLIADGEVEITDDAGSTSNVAMAFRPTIDVSNSLVTVGIYLERVSNPVGNIQVEIREDNSGAPGTLIATSDAVPVGSIPSGAGFNLVNFNLATQISLTNGVTYHYVINGDNSYKISFGAGDGSIKVGVDETLLDYIPATTAQGTVTVSNNGNINFEKKSSASITVIDNNIRRRIQAKNEIQIVDNDFSGSNVIIVAGIGFEEGVDFSAGASITDTRDNLLAAINGSLSTTLLATPLDTDSIELTALELNFPGESGNALTIEVSESSPNNYSIRGTNFSGGVDGDKVTINGPKFLNTSLVSYTYDTNTGEVTFGSAVSLPAFETGMLFRDGAGNTFTVNATDDSSDVVLLSTGLTVDNTTGDEFSGSILGDFVFEFGSGSLAIGGDVDTTAENLRTAIDTDITNFTVTRATNVVSIEVDFFGAAGNDYTITLDDIGTSNFEVTQFTGGQNSDTITVGSDVFKAVETSSSPNEFTVGVDATTTAVNLADKIDALGNAVANASGGVVIISANTPGEAGNAVALQKAEVVSGTFTLSGSTLEGGQDNFKVRVSDDNTTFTARVPEADMPFRILFGVDKLSVVSKSDAAGNQVIPVASVDNQVDSSIGKRYFSDNGEVSFLLASKSENFLIIGADDVDVYGKGTVNGNVGIQVDGFVFRTSSFKDDVTNLRDNEIVVLQDDRLTINLLGGVE